MVGETAFTTTLFVVHFSQVSSDNLPVPPLSWLNLSTTCYAMFPPGPALPWLPGKSKRACKAMNGLIKTVRFPVLIAASNMTAMIRGNLSAARWGQF